MGNADILAYLKTCSYEEILQIKDVAEKEISIKKRQLIEADRALGQLYARCIKEITCDHQSDAHRATGSTTIRVGDVIEVYGYPIYKMVTFHPSGGEHFDVKVEDTEHFELFRSHLYVETVSFDRD